jgi:hypothetical protein
MNNDAHAILPALDWSDKSTNDLITAMLTFLPLLRWLELNADSRNGLFYHPSLAVDNLLRIDFETLRNLLGGGSSWGSGLDWNGVLTRATGSTRLTRSSKTLTGDPPIWIFLDLKGGGPMHPFLGPGQ